MRSPPLCLWPRCHLGMSMTRAAKLWLRCLLCLLGLLCLLCLLYLLLWLPLRLTLINSDTPSSNHGYPSWTTMTMLNLLYSGPLSWRKLICNLYSTPSTSCLYTFYGGCNYGCSRCVSIWILALLRCKLLCHLAFYLRRQVRWRPWILITGTTSDILATCHL